MTTKERVIVSAYTGIRMCDMDLIEAYVQEKLGRPVLSLSLYTSDAADE